MGKIYIRDLMSYSYCPEKYRRDSLSIVPSLFEHSFFAWISSFYYMINNSGSQPSFVSALSKFEEAMSDLSAIYNAEDIARYVISGSMSLKYCFMDGSPIIIDKLFWATTEPQSYTVSLGRYDIKTSYYPAKIQNRPKKKSLAILNFGNPFSTKDNSHPYSTPWHWANSILAYQLLIASRDDSFFDDVILYSFHPFQGSKTRIVVDRKPVSPPPPQYADWLSSLCASIVNPITYPTRRHTVNCSSCQYKSDCWSI